MRCGSPAGRRRSAGRSVRNSRERRPDSGRGRRSAARSERPRWPAAAPPARREHRRDQESAYRRRTTTPAYAAFLPPQMVDWTPRQRSYSRTECANLVRVCGPPGRGWSRQSAPERRSNGPVKATGGLHVASCRTAIATAVASTGRACPSAFRWRARGPALRDGRLRRIPQRPAARRRRHLQRNRHRDIS